MKFVIASAIAAALALSMTPALAKSKKQNRHQSYHSQLHQGWGSGTRNVSDPSFGNQAGIANARRTGRCVSDLGYGRYEYCGW